MARCVKKGSAIYTFLEASGLLACGSKEDIAAAKKQYWSQIRKEWKQRNRKEYKSYTIFFTSKEQILLERKVDNIDSSINQFIKNACLRSLSNGSGIDKKTIGKIREAFALFYNEMQVIDQRSHSCNANIKFINEKFTSLENKILSLLMYT